MDITVKLFGKFRLLGDEIIINVPEGKTVSALRRALSEKLALDDGAWIDDLRYSRFATDTQILSDNSELPTSGELAIIPPVSGG